MNKDVIITISTQYGDMKAILYEETPLHKENFIKLSESGDFDSTIFHRIIENFMIQGGGFTEALEEKPTKEPIVNESKNKLHNTRGTLAMARTNDPDSATAQFFINQRSNLRLDWSPEKDGYLSLIHI